MIRYGNHKQRATERKKTNWSLFIIQTIKSAVSAFIFTGLIDCTMVLHNACMNLSLHKKHPHTWGHRHTPGMWSNNIFPGDSQLSLSKAVTHLWKNSPKLNVGSISCLLGIKASLPTSSHLDSLCICSSEWTFCFLKDKLHHNKQYWTLTF